MNEPETEDQKRTLLLVDDDDAFRNRLVRAMEKRGYAVTAAGSVSEAQEKAHEVKPEFAVVDLRMPDGSGLDVVKTLRQARENMRIVILTGYGNIATAVAAVKVGAVDYL
ncbi:MAG: response regulator, partial [Rhodospirillaceae bacterium]|nr:response regulator [Rhodospirillaceae bacterium]